MEGVIGSASWGVAMERFCGSSGGKERIKDAVFGGAGAGAVQLGRDNGMAVPASADGSRVL